MHKFIEQASLVAAIALAALPVVAISTAHAAPVAVKVSDLNLGQASGSAALAHRIDRAAQTVCSDRVFIRDLNQKAACVKAVRSEAMDRAAGRDGDVVGQILVASLR